MPDTISFPSNFELRKILQERIPELTKDDPIFEHFPVTAGKYFRVEWEQQDNFTGLQQLRGLNGQPVRVGPIGSKRMAMEPGVYGEVSQIDEAVMTAKRQMATMGEPVDVTDEISIRTQHLQGREIDRMRQVLWSVATTGTFLVLNRDGTVMYTDRFPIATVAAAVPWSNLTLATPFSDIRDIAILNLGTSVSFGSDARFYVSRPKINQLLKNVNPNDYGRIRGQYGVTLSTLSDINKFLQDDGLPQIVGYDGNYLDEATGLPVRLMPADRGVLIGKRTTGEPIGAYQVCRNAVNLTPDGDSDSEGGSYTIVKVRDEVPPTIEVHQGHNGGPELDFPSALKILLC